MTRRFRNLRSLLFALGVLGLLPALAKAESVVLRNDTSAPVIIQGTIIVNRTQVVRSKPILVQPGDSASIVLPGNKIITVHDARNPSLLLNQSTVPAAREDQYYSIQPHPDNPAKAKLEPFTPPGK